MNDNMPSPNNSNRDAKRCPASKSSFQAWAKTVDGVGALPPLFSFLLPPEMLSLDNCPVEEDGLMPDSLEVGNPSAAPCMLVVMEMGGIELTVPSAASFLRGGCCSK